MGGSICVVSDIVGINTIWEAKDRLHVSTARHTRECSTRSRVPVFWAIAIAPPCYRSDFLVDIGLALGSSVTSYGVKVWRERDLCMIDLFVVCLECRRINLCVVVPIHVV
jgi:hypothetical protein